MAKRIWISIPLTTTADLKEEAVVSFLKGGTKKDLEVEVAAFITKWLLDKDVPFGIAFDSCGVDRALVIECLPKRLQKIVGSSAAAIAENVVTESGEVVPAEDAAEVADVGALEQVADVEDAEALVAGDELPREDGPTAEPVELP